MMERSYNHDGGSLIEIYQNCNIFNDAAFEEYTSRDKFDNVIELKHKEPMLFAKETKGIKMDGSTATARHQYPSRDSCSTHAEFLPAKISLAAGRFPECFCSE